MLVATAGDTLRGADKVLGVGGSIGVDGPDAKPSMTEKIERDHSDLPAALTPLTRQA